MKLEPNRLKKRLQSGEPTLAVYVTMPWPGIVEIIGAAGADVVIIDREHTTISLKETEALLIAARSCGVAGLVRVTHINEPEVTRALDMGADGIVFPGVNSAELAEQARRCITYPPGGVRTWGGTHIRRTSWMGETVADRGLSAVGASGAYNEEFLKWAEEELVTVFGIESPASVAAINEIIERGRPDIASFGMGDFSLYVRFSADAIKVASERVYDACRAHNVGTSIAVGDSSRTGEFYPGCYYRGGVDTLICSSAIGAAVAKARERMGAIVQQKG